MHLHEINKHEINKKRQRFFIVSAVGLAYWLTGILTWTYPPGYLAFGRVWAVIFVLAGWLAWMTLVYPGVRLATVSGALLVGSALFRAGAIYVELGWFRFWRAFYRSDEPAISTSFAIGGLSWLLIAILLWAGWPQIQAGIIGSKDGE